MTKDFFQQPVVSLAQSLLGQVLTHESNQGTASGIIVETEAYLSAGDLAAHSARGLTKRNVVMFGPAGRAYVYFTYGMHWLFNVTAGPEGTGEAVLIRALEPVAGLELMQDRRHTVKLLQLCSGPAKLVQALGIESSHNGHNLDQPPLLIQPGKPATKDDIITTTRVGIRQSAGLPLRFYLKNNSYVSKPWMN